MAQEIANPRRILAVSLEPSAHHLSRLIQDLTGAAAPDSTAPLAGSTHDLALKTSYYSVTIPIWLDLIASPAEWAASFLSEEARQVLDVLGGFVVVFALPTDSASCSSGGPAADTGSDELRDLLRGVGNVVYDGLGGWEWDGVRLAVGVGEGDADEWEELCAAAGLEFVQLPAQSLGGSTTKDGGGTQEDKLNEFAEKTGVARIREALEANDWALEPSALDDFGEFEADVDDNDDDDDEHNGENDNRNLGFGIDESDLHDLSKAIWDAGPEGETAPKDDAAGEEEEEEEEEEEARQTQAAETAGEDDGGLGDEDVAKVERMMRKLQAAREMGEGMSEAQRKRLAARAVQEVMRDL